MNSQSTINTLFIIGFFKIKFVLLKLAKMHNIKHTQTGRFTGLRTY